MERNTIAWFIHSYILYVYLYVYFGLKKKKGNLYHSKIIFADFGKGLKHGGI